MKTLTLVLFLALSSSLFASEDQWWVFDQGKCVEVTVDQTPDAIVKYFPGCFRKDVQDMTIVNCRATEFNQVLLYGKSLQTCERAVKLWGSFL